MSRLALALIVASIGPITVNSHARADDWLQFRGANAAGLAVGQGKLPAEIGPEQHVLWKTSLPPGHSSPVIAGSRIYLTAVRDEHLLTIGLDRATGKILWEAEAPHEVLETVHRIGSHAQSSPATDGKYVVSFFGSSGLYCYDTDGHELWHHRMGPFKNDFGAGSSPLIVDDHVILGQDHDTDSFLAVYDKATGRELWKIDRSEFPRNFATPVIWTVGGRKQIVCAATLRVVGYDFEDGRELWTVRGIARFVSATPVVGDDGTLYVAGWAAGGDAGGERFIVPAFDDVVAEYDKNKNGGFEEAELPEGPIKQRFTQVDRDKSGSLSREEYDFFRRLFSDGKNLVVAIRPGGTGEITGTHVLWTNQKQVPFCASPLFTDGRLFTVKDGGILASLDARTGKQIKLGRLSSGGAFYSSPVAGDGKVYLVSEPGNLTVISSDGEWQILHTADFGENVYATPAIVDGRIYLRTTSALYCFAADAK
ncbi:MAG TPA: PQQ-binding-like beta-propeller repeat protein [Planctomycetaceae bacterium]|nr:PQQ-binding-like beta-propeller repeat protein [Planctomycetaceae bacterium]